MPKPLAGRPAMWNLSRHVCAMASQRVKPIFEPNGILRSHRSCHHYTVTVFSLIRVHDTTVIYGSQSCFEYEELGDPHAPTIELLHHLLQKAFQGPWCPWQGKRTGGKW